MGYEVKVSQLCTCGLMSSFESTRLQAASSSLRTSSILPRTAIAQARCRYMSIASTFLLLTAGTPTTTLPCCHQTPTSCRHTPTFVMHLWETMRCNQEPPCFKYKPTSCNPTYKLQIYAYSNASTLILLAYEWGEGKKAGKLVHLWVHKLLLSG